MIREILDVYAYDQLRRGPRPDAGDGDEAFVRSVPRQKRGDLPVDPVRFLQRLPYPPCKHPDLRVLRVDPSL